MASSGHSHRCYYFAGHAAPPRCHPEFTRVFSLPPPPPESPVNLPGPDLYGVRQYLSQHATLHLYGWTAQRLPDWFTTRFRAEYHRKCLFREQPGALLHVSPLENRSGAPEVSAPERAFLEMISEIGVRQPRGVSVGGRPAGAQATRSMEWIGTTPGTAKVDIFSNLGDELCSLSMQQLSFPLDPWSAERAIAPIERPHPGISRAMIGPLVLGDVAHLIDGKLRCLAATKDGALAASTWISRSQLNNPKTLWNRVIRDLIMGTLFIVRYMPCQSCWQFVNLARHHAQPRRIDFGLTCKRRQ